MIEDLSALEAELGDYRGLVKGETDSERFFALITRYIDEHDGDVAARITAAVAWVADHLRMLSLNFVLISATEMWALRLPDTHDLLVLRRSSGGPGGHRHLDHAARAGTVRARSGQLAELPAVVVATEQMDEDPDWESLCPGELLHVATDRTVTRTMVRGRPARHQLTLADLTDRAAAAQSPNPV